MFAIPQPHVMRPLVAVAALVLATPLAAQESRPALTHRLDSLSRAWLASGPSAGATIAVVRGRDTLLLEALGERDHEGRLPATVGTVYRIGSITKQFTAAAVMQLVEQGRIGLADPIGRYLRQYPQWKAVTVRQLLDHTSGIHSYTSNAAWAKTWSQDLTPAQLVDFVARDTFDFAPGTHWSYNNTGYILLGMLLDRVTGQPYPTYMRAHFFVPLGMRSASYCPSKPGASDGAKGYTRTATAIEPAPYLSMTHPYSAGALCMSVPDYLRWQTALTSGKVVSPASYALMSRSDTLANGEPTNYGFGLAPGMLGGHRFVTHGGAVHGFLSEQSWFPDDSLRVVVFSNTTGSKPDRLLAALSAAALGVTTPAPAPLPTTAIPLPVPASTYAGVYDVHLPNGATMATHVTAGDAGLLMRGEGPGQSAFPLRYLGDGSFGAEFDPTLRVSFFFAADGAATMTVTQHDQQMTGARRR
jgi:D-alanyl-D-alanine carboxypeptidase